MSDAPEGTTTDKVRNLLLWVVGPVCLGVLAARSQASGEVSRDAEFFNLPEVVQPAENAELEAAVFRTVANAAWALADAETVKRVMQAEIERLASAGGRDEALAYTRYGLVDRNPDGRMALFARACVADPKVCEDREAFTDSVAATRFVPPGNAAYLEMMKGHPPIGNAP